MNALKADIAQLKRDSASKDSLQALKQTVDRNLVETTLESWPSSYWLNITGYNKIRLFGCTESFTGRKPYSKVRRVSEQWDESMMISLVPFPMIWHSGVAQSV